MILLFYTFLFSFLLWIFVIFYFSLSWLGSVEKERAKGKNNNKIIGIVENEKQRLQQCKVHQGVAIRINNEEGSTDVRTRKCKEQVNTAGATLASAELLEVIEAVPFHEEFIH